MSIDWAPKKNLIVSCAADRNGYVWTQSEDGKWQPTLVMLRMNRAATYVRWSPQENKFAVGCGARLISVCYFEAANNWWVSKHIKKPIRSTITTLDWHPNNMLLVAGSTDFKVRVFSAYIKDIDEPCSATPWGTKMTLGNLLYEVPNSKAGGGWIHSVNFSGDGNKICWVGHDSAINIVDATKNFALSKLRTEYLPFLCCMWISPNSIIVAGHDCIPLAYKIDANGQISFGGKIDSSQKKGLAGLTAMKKFQSLDRNARIETNDINLDSIHQNAINCLCIYKGSKLSTTKVSTSGLDGQLVIWDLCAIEKTMQGLKIV